MGLYKIEVYPNGGVSKLVKIVNCSSITDAEYKASYLRDRLDPNAMYDVSEVSGIFGGLLVMRYGISL